MTVLIQEDQRKNFLKIIENECCWFSEGVCQQMGKCIEQLNVVSVLCKDAREYIIPEHPELQGKSTGFKKRCTQCGGRFESRAKTKSLCEKCATLNRRKQFREQKQKQRLIKV